MNETGLKPATVGELIAHLRQFPEEMPVLYQCCSDWSPLDLADVTVQRGVAKDYWVMRAYDNHVATMSEENRANIREFLVFPGN